MDSVFKYNLFYDMCMYLPVYHQNSQQTLQTQVEEYTKTLILNLWSADHWWSMIKFYRIYTNIPHIFFPEFSEEKLGCAHYMKQGWFCSASQQMIPSRVKE